MLLFDIRFHKGFNQDETFAVLPSDEFIFLFYFSQQFNCTNTLNDQILENVTVQMDTSDEFEVVCHIPCPKLPYNVPGTTYTCVAVPEDPTAGKSFVSQLLTDCYLFIVNLSYVSLGDSGLHTSLKHTSFSLSSCNHKCFHCMPFTNTGNLAI